MSDDPSRPAAPRSAPRISVAVPLYNEEAVLPELLRRLGAVLDGCPGGPHEMVFVDDGSADRTFALLREAAARDPRIVALRFSRNFGHQAAFTAALEHTSGDVVLVMDGDLQDPPEMIPRFLEAWSRGHDVVYARRVRRKEGPLLRACYFVFYRLMRSVSNTPMPLDSGDFALLSRRVVDTLNGLRERHRYIRGLRAWVGFSQTGIEVERDARFAGESKYTWAKLIRLALDGIFSFTVVPLRAMTLLGIATIVLSLGYTAWSLYERLFLETSPAGFTTLINAMIFFAGVQLLFLGILGEYVGRIYEELKSRPHYLVAEVVRGEGRGAGV